MKNWLPSTSRLIWNIMKWNQNTTYHIKHAPVSSQRASYRDVPEMCHGGSNTNSNGIDCYQKLFSWEAQRTNHAKNSSWICIYPWWYSDQCAANTLWRLWIRKDCICALISIKILLLFIVPKKGDSCYQSQIEIHLTSPWAFHDDAFEDTVLSCWLTIHEHLPTGCHSRLSTRCSLAQDNPFHSSEWCISVECVLGNSSQLYRNKNIEVGLLLSIRNSQQPWHEFQRPYLSNCLVMAAFKSKNPTVEFFLQLHWFCMGWNCSSWVIASGSFGFFQSPSMESSSTQDLFCWVFHTEHDLKTDTKAKCVSKLDESGLNLLRVILGKKF